MNLIFAFNGMLGKEPRPLQRQTECAVKMEISLLNVNCGKKGDQQLRHWKTDC